MQTDTRSCHVNTLAAHPSFVLWVEDYKNANDTVDGGTTTIKLAEARYLPPTSGQLIQWNKAMPGILADELGTNQFQLANGATCQTLGAYAYYLYQFRAVWYDYPAETVRQMVGRMTSNPAEVDLGTGLEEMADSATPDGEGFDKLIETVLTQQSKYSRCGVLADFPETATTNPPYLCVYGALRVKNWHVERDPITGLDKLMWLILDESKYVPNGINYEYRHVIRVCALDEEGNYFTQLHNITALVDGSGQLSNEIALNFLTPGEDAVYPTYKDKMAKEIPFVFINATNIDSEPELPILNTVIEKSLAIYRGEADYRQAQFMQGQAMPLFKGVSMEEASAFLLGATGGAASMNDGFDGKFMEVAGDGMDSMEKSLTNLHTLAVQEGSKLLNSGKNESGDALQERTDSQTISLNTIVSTCESGLIKLIDIVKQWGGITSDTEIVLNREFTSGSATPDGLVKLMQAFNMGAPITRQDVHEWAREGGLSETAWEEVEENLDQTGRNANFSEV